APPRSRSGTSGAAAASGFPPSPPDGPPRGGRSPPAASPGRPPRGSVGCGGRPSTRPGPEHGTTVRRSRMPYGSPPLYPFPNCTGGEPDRPWISNVLSPGEPAGQAGLRPVHRAGSAWSSGSERLLRVDEDRDRPVVDQLHLHVRLKPAGLHLQPHLPQPL